MSKEKVHLNALAFELVIDVFTFIVLVLAYAYTYNTLNGGNNQMDFIRNAFVFIAPSSIEGFRIVASPSKEDVKWDKIELLLSILSIIISVLLMIQCVLNLDVGAILYSIIIVIYPIRIINNIGFELINLVSERRVNR